MRLEGKTAIITGAAQGIGREIALTFAREGADVVIADVQVEAAREIAAEMEKIGRKALVVKTDVSNSEDVNRMVRATVDKFGKIDILVNDAGICVVKSLQELSEEDWDKQLDINLKGTFLCTKRVVQEMLNRGKGKIVNIASGLAQVALPNYSAYTASKGGVMSLTRALALELAPKGINVNAVAPGLIATPLQEARIREEGYEKLVEGIPIGRLGRPDDVAQAVLYLASEESDFVVGETIFITGGSTIAQSTYRPRT